MELQPPPLIGLNLRSHLEAAKSDVLDSVFSAIRAWVRERHPARQAGDESELVNSLSLCIESILTALIDR